MAQVKTLQTEPDFYYHHKCPLADILHLPACGRMTRNQAALLAAILPDPSKWNAAAPGPYVAGRARVLLGQAAVMTRDGLD